MSRKIKTKPRLTNDQFIAECIEKHGDKYNYSKTVYNGYYEKVCVICPFHKEFWQRAGDHKRGHGCEKCGDGTLTTQQFVDNARKIHGDRYDYSLVVYIDTNTEVWIICPKHKKPFLQLPRAHMDGHNCHDCAKESQIITMTSTTKDFIEKAVKVHGDLYSYEKVDYKHSLIDVVITCVIHGDFPQKPGNHLDGSGCKRCSHRVSRPEVAWLDSLGISDLERQKFITAPGKKKQMKVDGFDPKTNTIYEYYGDFWHGNPAVYKSADLNRANKQSYGSLYKETLDREKILRSMGYTVVSMWEYDWKAIQKAKKENK
jgi:hypothetical protein